MNNRGFALKSFLVVVALSMVVVLTVYLVQDKGPQIASVADFYNRYLKEREIDEEALTDELALIIRTNGPSSLICVESIPDDIEIERVEERDGLFAVHLKHLDDPILVTVDENGRIARIECPLKEESEVVVVVEDVIPIEEDGDERIIPTDIPPVLRAKFDLAVRLGIDTSEIEVKSAETVIFSDSTLGMSAPGEVYDQRLTPGYLIFLSAEGNGYRYHADETRTIFVP